MTLFERNMEMEDNPLGLVDGKFAGEQGSYAEIEKIGGNQYHIERLFVPEGMRGGGMMKKMVGRLVELADMNGLELSTNICPDRLPNGEYDTALADGMRRTMQRYGFRPLEMDGTVYRNDLSREPAGGGK